MHQEVVTKLTKTKEPGHLCTLDTSLDYIKPLTVLGGGLDIGQCLIMCYVVAFGCGVIFVPSCPVV